MDTEIWYETCEMHRKVHESKNKIVYWGMENIYDKT